MIQYRKLDSGITLVMEKITYLQSVAMGIWVKAGSVDETEKYSGISHFVEHMSFKGTEKRSAKAIAEDVDRIGGQINAFTGREATCYYVKSTSGTFRKAADVLVDMMENSLFSTEEMNKERKVICEEIKMTLDSPEDLAHDTITANVFKGSDLGKSIIGTPETLNNIDHDAMKDYVRRQYTRDSIVVSVCGNFDEDEIVKYFDKKLLCLAESKKSRKISQNPYNHVYECIKKDIEQTHVCLATKCIPITDPDYYAFKILNNVMGGSMSSRFFQNIREEKGLAYSVYSMLGPFTYDGYFNIYAGVSHEKAEEAIRAIKDELDILKKDGITSEELESSREQMKASFIFSLENVSGRMFRNGKNLLLTDRIIEENEVIDGLDSVTMGDIDRIKGSLCNFENYSAVVVTNNDKDVEKIMQEA